MKARKSFQYNEIFPSHKNECANSSVLTLQHATPMMRFATTDRIVILKPL